MQLSGTGLVDPGGLIEALHLSECDQQDAPEFHSLFMSLLESRFLSLGKTVIQPLFKGTCIYETRCQACGLVSDRPSSFLEIDLKVSSANLTDCIRNYLAEELLTGENRYACSRCSGKRDGVRRTRIDSGSTPLMLCLQLLRFTYDVRSGRRVKQKTPIRLPDILDMAPFLSGSTGPVPYRLSGVLLHIGRQSTSGHYIAVVRTVDADGKDSWNICNDEHVLTVPANDFDLSKVNGTNQSVSFQKVSSFSSKPGTPIKCEASSSIAPTPGEDSVEPAFSVPEAHVSSTAYVVFYRKLSDFGPPAEIEVPERLRGMVEASNTVYESNIESRRLEQMEQKALDHRRKELRARFVSLLSLPQATSPPDCPASPISKRHRFDNGNDHPLMDDDSDLNEFSSLCIVPSQWLMEWFKEPEHPPPQLTIITEDKDCLPLLLLVSSSSPPDISLQLCLHGAVSPDTPLQNIRAISLEGLKRCLGQVSDPPGDPNSDSRPRVLFVSTKVVHCLQPCLECLRQKVAANLFAAECNSINKEMLRWKKISGIGGGGIWPLSPAATAFCEAATTTWSHSTGLSSSPNSSSGPKTKAYFIGAKSFSRWRVMAQTFFGANSFSLSASSDPRKTDFNADAFCSHGRLLLAGPSSSSSAAVRCVPAPLWHRLRALFRGAEVPTRPAVFDADYGEESVCPECAIARGDLIARATRESELLADVLAFFAASASQNGTSSSTTNHVRRSLSCLISTETNENHRGGRELPINRTSSTTTGGYTEATGQAAVYLVPMDFVQQWRRFIRQPSATTLPSGDVPSGLSADDALCEHDHLLMPWNELLDENIVFPLSAREWSVLRTCYGGAPPLPPTEKDGDPAADDYPPLRLVATDTRPDGFCVDVPGDSGSEFGRVCDKCYQLLQQRRADFVGARIIIRLVSGPDDVLSSSTVDLAMMAEANGQDDEELDGDEENGGGPAKVEKKSKVCSEIQLPLTTSAPSSASDHHLRTGAQSTTSSSNSTGSFVRRSTRTRANRDDYTLRVDGSSKLQDVRIQMMGLLGAAPFDQHMALDGVELTDYSRTLIQLGIKPGTVLHMWVDVPTPNAASEILRGVGGASAKKSTTSSPVPSKPDLVEIGFKGTRLLDCWSPAKEEEEEDEQEITSTVNIDLTIS